MNNDLDYIGGTEGTIDYYVMEREMLSDFLKENPSKRGKTVFANINDKYVKSIYCHAEYYGYTKEGINEILNKKVAKLSASAEM